MPPAFASASRGETLRKFAKTVVITNPDTNRPKTFKLKIQQVDRINNLRKYVVDVSPPATDTEQFYNIVNEAIEDVGDVNSINLFFDTEGGVQTRAIDSNYLDDFNDFEERYNEVVAGGSKKYGSDPIEDADNTLRFNKFGIVVYSTKAVAFGKADSMLFNIVGVDGSKKLCAFECLKKLGYEFKGKKPECLSNLQYLIQYIDEKKLPIDIMNNAFNLNKYVKDYDKPKIKLRIEERLHNCIELDDCDIVLKSIYNCSKNDITPKHTLIYDEGGQHIDISVGLHPQLCAGVLVDKKCQVIKNNKIIYTANQVNKLTNNKENTQTQYVFFDYETVIDFNHHNCMKEYSLSILSVNEEELIQLEEADKNNDVDTVARLRSSKCITFLGHSCSLDFIKWILENQDDKAMVFIGFNNSSFDNFFFLDALLRHDTELTYNVEDIFYNGSQILNFNINGRHSTFDIRKHLMGSLANNCKSFKINCCAKKSFDHDKAQQLYEENKLIEFINNNEELKEYNEYDVLATAVLYRRYVNALQKIDATKQYADTIFKIKTIGSLIYKVFVEHTKKEEIKLPNLTYNQYKDLQRSKIAGRVEMFNGIQKVNERLASTDVCSLYPFVMSVLDVYYPCGEIKDVNEYAGDEVLGFYYCDIDQSILKKKNLPNIYAYKTGIENIWNYEGVIENYLLSNIMIGLLRKYNCDITIRNGFVFTEKKKSCDMFKFLLDIMKAKNEQDGFKSSNNPEYNPALRETHKLLMNSLSGKVIEGLHTEKTEDIKTDADFLEIKNKAKTINVINNVGNRIFLTYTVDEEKVCEKQQRPIYLGVLVYDYAKRYMFENSYSKIGLDRLLYTDTDASKFRYTDMEKWRNWIETENVIVPHWKEVEEYDERYKDHLIYNPNSKVFGSFEDELEEMVGNEYMFYCLEKKSWLYSADKKTKYRFKGLNDNAIMITLREKFIDRKYIEHQDGNRELKYWINPKSTSQISLYNYIHQNKELRLGSNAINFFEKLYVEKSAFVLVSSFRKIVKNSAREVSIEDEKYFNPLLNKVQARYMLKKISIKDYEGGD